MGLRRSLSCGQLTCPHPVQGLRRGGSPAAKHAEASTRKNMQHMREPGARLAVCSVRV
jgi:hypothetical protein